MWEGPLLVKGALHSADCRRLIDEGADGIIISNHGGRQLDAAPSPISLLPSLRAELGDKAVIAIDSGIRSGIDIARAIALGADFCFLGRAFLMGVAALGTKGAHHVGDVLIEELENVMVQLGVSSLEELRLVQARHPFNP